MIRKIRFALLSVAIGVAQPYFLQAQDSPQVKEHLDAAKKIAGSEWAAAQQYFCSTEEQVAPTLPSATAKDYEGQYVEPTRIFDNLYYIGTKGVATFAITTTDGIIMIDAGYPDRVEPTLIAGMKKVGLDPAKIKYVIVTHGHVDHFGGSFYLQEHYGAHVALSAIDWDQIAPKPGKKQPEGEAPPRRDVVAVDGQPITLGDVQVTPVLIPGHTPGSMGMIFPVKEGGQTHMVGLFGSLILSASKRVPVPTFQEYLRSIDHFADVSRRMRVDVELENHPLMDNTLEKLARLRARKPGEPNPFVVGQASYGRFLDVMSECMKMHIARRGGE
jgi:metallo-beta-lactamase class B